MDNSIQYLIDSKFKERKKKTNSESAEDNQLTNADPKTDIAVEVINGTVKNQTPTLQEPQPCANQEVSETTILSLTKSPNITKIETSKTLKSKKKTKNSISANPVMEVNNGPKKEEAKIVKQSRANQEVSAKPALSLIKTTIITKIEKNKNLSSKKETIKTIIPNPVLEVNNSTEKEGIKLVNQSHVDQEVSATPVLLSNETANITTVENKENLNAENEIKNSIIPNPVLVINNGQEMEEAKLVRQLHVDQEVSVTPVLSLTETTNMTTVENKENLNAENEIKNSIIPNLVLEINNGPEMEEAELVRQLHVDQEVSVTSVLSLTETANITTVENVDNLNAENETKNSIIPNLILEVNNGQEMEEVELVRLLHVDQEVSATPILSLTETANITTVENVENLNAENETKNSIISNPVLEVNNGSEKEEAKIVNQSHVDQEVSATPVLAWTETANTTTMENNEHLKAENKMNNSIIPNPVLEVNNGSEKEEAKTVNQSHVYQEVSATPILSLTETANITTVQNDENLNAENETKTSIIPNPILEVNNGQVMEEANIVNQSHVDQELSETPGPSWLNNSNPVEVANVLNNIKDFNPEKSMENNQESVNNNGQSNSGIHINQRPENEEGSILTQALPIPDQGSVTFPRDTASSAVTSEINNFSGQTQLSDLTERTRRTIYVGNLDFSVNAMDLMNCFSYCGIIMHVMVMNDRVTTHSRGYAFIEFNDVRSAELATNMNNFSIRGRKLVVQPKRTNDAVNYRQPNSQQPSNTFNTSLPIPMQMPMSESVPMVIPATVPMAMSVPTAMLMAMPMTMAMPMATIGMAMGMGHVPMPMCHGHMSASVPMLMPMSTPMPMSMSMVSAPTMPAPITPFNYVQQNVPQQMGTGFMPNMYYQNPNYYPQ